MCIRDSVALPSQRGPEGVIVSVERFGASAPGAEVLERFGFTPENVAQLAREVLKRAS